MLKQKRNIVFNVEEEEPNKPSQQIIGRSNSSHVAGEASRNPANIPRVVLAQGAALTRPSVGGEREKTSTSKMSFYVSSDSRRGPRMEKVSPFITNIAMGTDASFDNCLSQVGSTPASENVAEMSEAIIPARSGRHNQGSTAVTFPLRIGPIRMVAWSQK